MKIIWICNLCLAYKQIRETSNKFKNNKMEKTHPDFIIYETEGNLAKVSVRLVEETVWLTQKQLAEIFDTTKQNIGQHIKNIVEEGELDKNSVVKFFFTTATDGKNYNTEHYNLDMIISLGYRINSKVATKFRQWATILKHCMFTYQTQFLYEKKCNFA